MGLTRRAYKTNLGYNFAGEEINEKVLNQPIEIQLTNNRWIKNFYDGAGRLYKTTYSTGEYWEYLDGMVFKNGAFYQLATPEGRAVYESGGWSYEYFHTDHLGNTHIAYKANGTALTKTSETSFDPWGVILNGINFLNSYQNRFEFLNREKESTFNLNAIRLGARMYNPTIGRFDRVDAIADEQENYSPYQYGWNNPIKNTDPDGKCPLCGFVIGITVDYAFQVAGNMANGKSFAESLTHDINLKSIAISGAAVLATSGLSAIGGKGAQFAIGTAIDATESIAKQATSGDGSITLSQTVSDVASNKVAGLLTKKAENIIDTKVLGKEADRTARVSANDPSSTGRAARAETARSNLNKAETINKATGQTVSGIVGNTIQNTSNAVRTPSGTNNNSQPLGVAKSDATNIEKRPLILILQNK